MSSIVTGPRFECIYKLKHIHAHTLLIEFKRLDLNVHCLFESFLKKIAKLFALNVLKSLALSLEVLNVNSFDIA